MPHMHNPFGIIHNLQQSIQQWKLICPLLKFQIQYLQHSTWMFKSSKPNDDKQTSFKQISSDIVHLLYYIYNVLALQTLDNKNTSK